MSQSESIYDHSRAQHNFNRIVTLARFIKESKGKKLKASTVSIWSSWWAELEVSYERIVNRMTKRYVYIKDQLTNSKHAFDPNHPDTIQKEKSINYLKEDILVLSGAQILLSNLSESYLENVTQLTQENIALKSTAEEYFRPFDLMAKKLITFNELYNTSSQSEKILIDLLMKQCETNLKLKEEIKKLKHHA